MRAIAAGAVAELVVQVDRGADERQVAECLREVAELLAGAADLFGVQAEVVGVGVHLLERQPRLVEPPGCAPRAATYQKVHSEKVPSPPASPSGEAARL